MCPETVNQLADAMEEMEIIWSTLEAIHDALLAPDSVAKTYYGALRGAADEAFRVKNIMAQIVININLDT